MVIGSKDVSTDLINRYMEQHLKTMFDFLHYHKDIADDLVKAANDNADKKGWGANVFAFLGKKKS